jgi:hypothetical protein
MRNTLLALGLVALPGSSALAQTAPDATPAPVQAPTPTAIPDQPTTPASDVAPARAATPVPTVASAASDNAGRGKIVMYRGSSIVGMGIACPIRYQGREIVELARGKYAEWAVAAGHYVLTNKTSSVDLAVSSGETRYVRCMIKPGFLVGRADLQVVDEQSFAEHSKELEKKDVATN